MRIRPCSRKAASFLLALALLALPAPARAASAGHAFEFLRLASDPVGRSLSGAHIASVAGPCAVAWNPAGLAAPEPGALLLSHTAWMGETTWDWGGVSLPAGGGALGISCALFRAGDLEAFDENGGALGDFSPTQATASAGYGRCILGDLEAGAVLEWGYESDGFDASHSGWACSAGLRYVTGPLGVAAVIRHFGPSIEAGEDRFSWPRTLAFGASVRTALGLTVHAGVERAAGEAAAIAAGCEWQATDGLSLLGGLKAPTGPDGSRPAPSAGLLFDVGRASFSYGYQVHEELTGAHQIALSLRFS